MVPTVADERTYWDHVFRYRFAAQYVRQRDVLDIACGEGYGAAALRQAGARSIVGIDISRQAVEHAIEHYGLDARVGGAELISLADHSVDVVVSFETIEHVSAPARFVSECARVLRPGGTLIVSTPNKTIYDIDAPDNPYHVSELTLSEFQSLLADRFEGHRYFGQGTPAPFYARTRGLGRLWKVARRLLDADYSAPLTPELRTRTVELACGPTSLASRIWSMAAIRELSRRELEQSCYILAVARAPGAD